MGKLLIRRKFGVSAALFALLIQFVASFGHVQLDHSGFQPATVELARAVRPDGDRVSKPDSDKHLADICDVCATLNLVASGQIASPPALPTPIAYSEDKLTAPVEILPAGIGHLNFHSRAPPSA